MAGDSEGVPGGKGEGVSLAILLGGVLPREASRFLAASAALQELAVQTTSIKNMSR